MLGYQPSDFSITWTQEPVITNTLRYQQYICSLVTSSNHMRQLYHIEAFSSHLTKGTQGVKGSSLSP